MYSTYQLQLLRDLKKKNTLLLQQILLWPNLKIAKVYSIMQLYCFINHRNSVVSVRDALI